MLSTKHLSSEFEARSRETLEAWELALIDVFVRAADMFGMRRSVGMVYGALYCAREPISTQALQDRLALSRGAVVEALQFLRRLGAVRVHLKIGERRDFFSAETDLKKFARGFLKEILEPALEKAEIRLEQARDSAGTASAATSDFARSRIDELARRKARFAEILPLLENLLD